MLRTRSTPCRSAAPSNASTSEFSIVTEWSVFMVREVVEAEQLRVDDRDIAVLGADVLLALPVSTRNRFGHQGFQQFVVLLALCVDQFLLGLQAGAEVVE